MVHLWAAQRDDCVWLDKVELYRPCRVSGVVTQLRICPRSGAVEVKISDGTAPLCARWPLARPVEQAKAAPGVGLILEGIARIDQGGELVMIEPVFEIVPGPCDS
jgi:hypothetical protein